MDISIVLCSKNRAMFLEECLDRICEDELLRSNGEIILVDNGSEDDTFCVMKEFQDRTKVPVKVVQEPVPGLGRARNAGIRASSGTIIVFSDDDCYLAEGYIPTAVHLFSGGRFHYCSGNILQYDLSDSPYGCRTHKKFSIINPGSFIPAGQVQGANLAVHRDVFKRIGLFDPLLGAGTKFRCEDLDICARASLAGFTGALAPELIVYHHHRRKPGEAIEELKRENDYSRGAYYAKFVFKGKGMFLSNWIKRAVKRGGFFPFIRELYGFFSYVLYTIVNGRSRTGYRDFT